MACIFCCFAVHAQAVDGKVLLVGGGKTTPAIIQAFVQAAGGPNARLVILAQVEKDPATTAPESVALFRAQGATQVEAPVGKTAEELLSILKRAQGVWIPGGDQNRFLVAFPQKSGIPDAIREVWKRGGVVGGTSAGASLMGEWMPAGSPTGGEGLQQGTFPVVKGLNLLPQTLVDQHFLVRNRLLRMLTGLLEHPQILGIGLDENAWALVQNGILTVKKGQVTLVRISSPVHTEDKQLGAERISLSILLNGEQSVLAIP